ncbi:MAG: Tll0287-like domain-containing protein [Thermoanaerobaculaceae bacterium]
MVRAVLCVNFLLVPVLWGQMVAQPQELASPQAWALEEARRRATAFAQEMMATLMAELKASGASSAVSVCAKKAPELAKAHAGQDVTVRRVTLQPRNPANRPDAFEEEQLRVMAKKAAAGESVGEVWQYCEGAGEPVLRYLRPIFVGELCLQCHGPRENLDPELRRVLAELYPEDQAVGYRPGDFRGALSVTVHVKAKGSGKS